MTGAGSGASILLLSMNQKTTLFAAVAVCIAVGFMVGRISSDSTISGSERTDDLFGPRAGKPTSPRQGSPTSPRAAEQSDLQERGFRSTSQSDGAWSDPIARMEAIINNPDPLDRAEQWLRFVKGLDATEIEDVIVTFRGKGLAGDNLSEYSMLLSAWAKYDPISALDYAKQNTGSPFARQTILTSWATTDPVAAMRWAEKNHDGEGANPWMVGVIRGIAASDPARATELMNAMPYSRERGDALTAVMGHYLKQGPEAARSWAISIEDERLRDGAISRIADKLAITDAAGTADWLIANPGEGSARAMDDVMERMTEADPQAAISYFNNMTDETMKKRALEGITDELAVRDPLAALSLMDSNPSLMTDGVVQEFVWSARSSEPALGASAIARMQSDEERERTYRRYIGSWMRRDIDGALSWVNQNQLSESVQRSVQSMAERIRNEDR